jgi:hypothetical protein
MIYVMGPNAQFPTTTGTIKAPLLSTKRDNNLDKDYLFTLSNDLSKETKTVDPFNIQNTPRFSNIFFSLVFNEADDGYVHARGKLILYPYGNFETTHKFGNEVTYKEHTNPTTNNIYIQA